MNNLLSMLAEFNHAFGVAEHTTPGFPPDRDFDLAIELLDEETNELNQAETLLDALDALADIGYVWLQAVRRFGMASIIEQALLEVHRSNMSKLNPSGLPVLRADGKILKGPNYSPPNLVQFLIEQKDVVE